MTNKPTAPDLRASDSLAMALGRIEVDMGRFKSGQGIGRPYTACDADLAAIRSALLLPTPIPQGEDGWLRPLELALATISLPIFVRETADYAEVFETGDDKQTALALTMNSAWVDLVNAGPRLIAIARAAGGKQ